MLVNCPRCGFSQPKDQYCAQCGIDMQSYKPKEKPFLAKTLGNMWVQIGILLLIGVSVGQYIIRGEQPQKWVQKINPMQGVSRSERSSVDEQQKSADGESQDAYFQGEASDSENYNNENLGTASAAGKREVGQGKNWAGANSASNSEAQNLNGRGFANGSSGAAAMANAGGAGGNSLPGSAQDLSSLSFKITYAEISNESLAKWVTESSNLGLYQALPDYSAGIIYDFRRKTETFQQTLKSADLKVNVGSANSSISGVMSDDGVQMIGLVAGIEYRSNENESIHGNINIARSSRQGTDNFPAEFSLPRGAAFFIVGTIKRDSFINDRPKLTMPPFQIFKSPDFMTRKTEFVIILEHDYK